MASGAAGREKPAGYPAARQTDFCPPCLLLPHLMPMFIDYEYESFAEPEGFSQKKIQHPQKSNLTLEESTAKEHHAKPF
ncbi:hypothetical protein DHL47_04595 [Streptococcus panodentis]|uniref:Uncharacterized protein n=1 Tax=Streptococcus panodentis TaxID=1581472 RepID=A0ABS5AVN0_9STRE|nr:hypothetical protein [Streptococcus panodentis]